MEPQEIIIRCLHSIAIQHQLWWEDPIIRSDPKGKETILEWSRGYVRNLKIYLVKGKKSVRFHADSLERTEQGLVGETEDGVLRTTEDLKHIWEWLCKDWTKLVTKDLNITNPEILSYVLQGISSDYKWWWRHPLINTKANEGETTSEISLEWSRGERKLTFYIKEDEIEHYTTTARDNHNGTITSLQDLITIWGWLANW